MSAHLVKERSRAQQGFLVTNWLNPKSLCVLLSSWSYHQHTHPTICSAIWCPQAKQPEAWANQELYLGLHKEVSRMVAGSFTENEVTHCTHLFCCGFSFCGWADCTFCCSGLTPGSRFTSHFWWCLGESTQARDRTGACKTSTVRLGLFLCPSSLLQKWKVTEPNSNLGENMSF